MKVNKTKFKHLIRRNMYQAHIIFQQDFMKIGLLFLMAFIIFRKDISLEFSLHSKEYDTTEETVVVPDSVRPELMNYVEPPTVQPKGKNVAKQTFSSLAFVLNPKYAKKHQIDPAIVDAKNQIVFDYLKRYAVVAIAEMRKFGIPASITLAQALLESDAGVSRLATRNNNHFGIKCFSKTCRKGHCANFSDDSHKDFFRNYNSVWESYRDHSNFLLRSRYKHLLKLDKTDYKKWAIGLQNAGYATDKRYANKLIHIIQALELYKYDT